MNKTLLVIDVDDVLADTTEAVRHFVNKKYGHSLEKYHYQIGGQYWGYYEAVWARHDIDGDGMLDSFHIENSKGKIVIEPIEGAVPALSALAKRFRLAAVSSRSFIQQRQTEFWLETIFGDVFEDIHCIDSRYTGVSKGDFCRKLGAAYLVDDNTEHCRTAINAGITPLLFGSYGWQSSTEGLIRCTTWKEVQEYFDGRS